MLRWGRTLWLLGLLVVTNAPLARGSSCYRYFFDPPPGALPNATVGSAYDVLVYACCMGQITYVISAGSLPPGIQLINNWDNTADIAGNPTAIGTWSFDVTAEPMFCDPWTQSYSLTVINPPGCGTIAIAPATLPPGTIGSPYSVQLAASGGQSPYVWFVVEGTLPAGLTLSSSGLLSGTIAAGGVFSFKVGVTDSLGCNGTRDYVITVGCAPITIDPPALPDATKDGYYLVYLAASGGSTPYSFSVGAGSLPPGLSLGSWGTISGFPSQPGIFLFSIVARDAYGCAGSKPYALVVRCLNAITFSPLTLAPGFVGLPYQVTFSVFGGTPPYSFSVWAGSMPPGLTLSASGQISGTATSHGRFSFTILVIDALGCSGTQSYVLPMRGLPNYVLGQGLGFPNPNRVKVIDQGGRTHADFQAYAAGQWGVNVAGGDLEGDAGGRILTGPGPGAVFGPHLRAFDDVGAPLPKVSFFAYGTVKYGVLPAGAALDADYFEEILTGAGPGLVFPPHVRGWNYDATSVSAISNVSFYASSYPAYGSRVASGDLDGDRFGEIVTAPGPGPSYAPTIRGWYYRGSVITAMARVNFDAFPSPQYGAVPASGDVEADLYDELAATPGPGATLPARFRGFNFDDRTITAMPGFDITPYATLYGGTPALGDLALDRKEDLVTGAGPDPTAAARVKLFSYDGAALLSERLFLIAFPGGYGVNVASANLDH